jgi:TonB family protein
MRTAALLSLLLSSLYLFSDDKTSARLTRPMVECETAQPSRPCATGLRLLMAVLPEYKEEARQAELEGAVVLSLVVSKLGRTEEIRVVKSLSKELDALSIEAVTKWRYRPALYKDQSVPVGIEVKLNFRKACFCVVIGETQIIRGIVTDVDGKPLTGVVVRGKYVTSSGPPPSQVQTGDSGAFSMEVSAGMLLFLKDGYAPIAKDLGQEKGPVTVVLPPLEKNGKEIPACKTSKRKGQVSLGLLRYSIAPRIKVEKTNSNPPMFRVYSLALKNEGMMIVQLPLKDTAENVEVLMSSRRFEFTNGGNWTSWRGTSMDGGRWRSFAGPGQHATYDRASAKGAGIFDRFLGSACKEEDGKDFPGDRPK